MQTIFKNLKFHCRSPKNDRLMHKVVDQMLNSHSQRNKVGLKVALLQK